MKGSSVTAEQKKWHGMVAGYGCVACLVDGVKNSYVSIHHCDGRTKPWAHWFVLPLCGPHHQHETASGVPGFHPYKARFIAAYGTQDELFILMVDALLLLGHQPPQPVLDLVASFKA